MGEEKLILRVARLGRDAQVKEAYPSLQLAGEIHGLRGQPFPHELLGHCAKNRNEVLHRLWLLWTHRRRLVNVEAEGIMGTWRRQKPECACRY